MNYLDLGLSPESQKNLELVFQKCHEDTAFKQEFIANPVQTLEKITSHLIDTQGFNLVVADQSDRRTIYLNIPADQENVELTAEELEMVAGGSNWFDGVFKLGPFVFVIGDNNTVVVKS